MYDNDTKGLMQGKRLSGYGYWGYNQQMHRLTQRVPCLCKARLVGVWPRHGHVEPGVAVLDC
jgi:hypothetical protein